MQNIMGFHLHEVPQRQIHRNKRNREKCLKSMEVTQSSCRKWGMTMAKIQFYSYLKLVVCHHPRGGGTRRIETINEAN